MSEGATIFNTDLISALEALTGNTINEIICDEATVKDVDGEEEIKETVMILTSRKIDNVTVGRYAELIGDEWFLSKEYIADEGGLKNE